MCANVAGKTAEGRQFLSKITSRRHCIVRMRGLPYTATAEQIVCHVSFSPVLCRAVQCGAHSARLPAFTNFNFSPHCAHSQLAPTRDPLFCSLLYCKSTRCSLSQSAAANRNPISSLLSYEAQNARAIDKRFWPGPAQPGSGPDMSRTRTPCACLA